MSESIVVGYSDSAAGHRALDWAAARAASTEQPIHLVSIVGGSVGAVGEDSVRAAVTEQAEDDLRRATATLTDAGLAVTTEVRTGDPVRELIAASDGAALLVIGSDASAGEHRGVHGIRLTAGSHCPVVVVGNVKTSERRGVVVGIDGSETSAAAIRFAASEANRIGEPLVAVGVWTPLAVPSNPLLVTSEYLSSLAALTEEIVTDALTEVVAEFPDLQIDKHIVKGFPSAELLAAARSAKLLVVGSHGRGAIARFLLGSVSHEVLSAPTAPTAVVR